MSIKSILSPNMSVATAMGTAGVVLAIHATVKPDNGTMMATAPHDNNLEAARKQAAWLSIGAVSVISLLTRDVNVFVVGGAMAVALDWYSRYAIARHPATGQIVTTTPQGPTLSAVI